ncbi:glutamate-5-semialdehyde dehydrogenase [Parapedobacter sp. 10938]|uniref:glutamate-5-semialdehyde dehydrogenase n=1 Tax=Parapedobacter flavus TaxID=3110225 RepID=UPI002DBF3CC3|nr:glutamate-5-semialdehyde dehydrogenase [Parapedobacter sp. 10938]MEC3880376.1 glutamate-5-semialdehyde dehydrogenase [Parapedobacter sp. 10938]
MELLTTTQKNSVLSSMATIINDSRDAILTANQQDLDAFNREDRALYDRLVVDNAKVDGMIRAVQTVMDMPDPIGGVRSSGVLDNGLRIENRTAPFGTILIIYESRPDVTIEAAVVAFKANNKILLKGGKEAVHTNQVLVDCWHRALAENGLAADWIQLITLDREATREFLKNPSQPIDLIVPRGGEKLINFVKEHAQCAVLVSGRGNNFAYIAPDADWEKVLPVVINSKTDKISACNALDKVLVDETTPGLPEKLKQLGDALRAKSMQLLAEQPLLSLLEEAEPIADESVWYEEFLAPKICFGVVNGLESAVDKINRYSGGHSTVILTADRKKADTFMEQVDSAAVYHNASTRFTDGGAMGVGAELAISTDKLHHRGPLGLEQLVTNKYYVYGDGQVR